jgi:DNA-binding response OmpR family regulator
MRVLIVEDDRALGQFLQSAFQAAGHRVEWAEDGEDALVHTAEGHPDLVLLDLSLPKRDGMEVLAEMRAQHNDAVVLVLSGRNDVDARVQCLDMGADDYLLKPFSFVELMAHSRALLRRRRQFADSMLRHGDLELNRIEHKVTRAGLKISLTVKEFALLEYLMLHAGECVSRRQLLADVWQMPEETSTNVVDVYVNYLRRKIDGAAAGDAPGLIETVRGTGYRLGGPGRRPVARAIVRPIELVRPAIVSSAVCA